MKTIQDVARHAHVGAATVSRVINGSGYVKEDTRKKILKAIEELDYTPNEMARNLFHRKTGIVAVIMPEISYPYFGEFVNEVEIALYENGYQCLICNTCRERNYEERYLELLKQQRVDGIITGVHTLDTEIYDAIDGPIVALDRQLNEKIPCVAVDHETGGRLAAQELINAGCRNVVQCTGRAVVTTPSNDRHSVFAKVMEENGITCHNYMTKWNAFEYSYQKEAAEEITEKYPDADGFFATDTMALSLIKAACAKGRNYPEDFKVVAYDGTYVSDLAYPSMTTIVQPIQQLAAICVQVLVDMIHGKTPKERYIQLGVRLRRGDSTKKF